jgi:hypothetical protein
VNDYRPGERVRVTIEAPSKGTVMDVLHLALASGTEVEIPLEDDVAIERINPAEWPPQPGDLWRDRHGSTWFAFWGLDAGRVFMVPNNPVRGELNTPTPNAVMESVGPLALVHREEAS